MNFAAQMGMMLLGGLFVIWLRAVLSVKASGDTWDWHAFVAENSPRFFLAIIGVVIVGTAAYFDAGGVQSVLDKFGIGIQGAVGFGLGATLSAFVLIAVPNLNKLVSILIVLSLVSFMTACPKASIASAKSSSQKVATYANAGVDITRELYRAGKISLEKKDAIADGFIRLAEAGLAFDAIVASAERQYGSNAPPKGEIDRLFATFDHDVVAKLVDVLKELKVPGVSSATFGPTIELLKTAILTVAKAFGKREQIAAQISGA
jgi:hypothetical protein